MVTVYDGYVDGLVERSKLSLYSHGITSLQYYNELLIFRLLNSDYVVPDNKTTKTVFEYLRFIFESD